MGTGCSELRRKRWRSTVGLGSRGGCMEPRRLSRFRRCFIEEEKEVSTSQRRRGRRWRSAALKEDKHRCLDARRVAVSRRVPSCPLRRLEAKEDRLWAGGGGWRTPPWLVGGGLWGWRLGLEVGRRGVRVRGGHRWGRGFGNGRMAR